MAVSESKNDETPNGKLCIATLEFPLSKTHAKEDEAFKIIAVGELKLVLPIP